ncbi:MAG TPA: transcription antitermination factor NusB [Mariprofundaceae bacterium]|nr:transcription antitermination factor NusB [Mariprofundaceae bacterium]
MNIRTFAIDSLDRILNKKRKADEVLHHLMDEVIEEQRDAHFLHEMVYGVLRNYFSLETDFSRFLKQKPDEFARLALFVGTYQIRQMRVPVHAAVSETVDAVKPRDPKAAGMINAVLRKVADSEPPTKLKPYQRAELPNWMFASWRDAFGVEIVQAIAEANLTKPELTVAIFDDRDAWMQQASEAGLVVKVGKLSPQAVILPSGTAVPSLPGFNEGEFQVMDQAAQAAVLALDLKAGDKVFDLCAAPGGKSALLARLNPEVEVVAVELSEKRIPRLKENLLRVKAGHVTVVEGDATALDMPDDSVDAILLDAPCTASGVIRRHPDAKFLHDKEDVLRHSQLQQAMVAEALRVLKPGGQLLYAVCSIHPEENEQVVEGLVELQSTRRLFPSVYHDGFFIAQLKKR